MNLVLLRAGALGDVLLLRRAVFALRSAGHRVALVAPADPGSALVGPGLSEVERLWPWDGAAMAALLAGDTSETPLVAALRAADVVLCYTRAQAVIEALSAVSTRLVAHDPVPPEAGPHASRWLARPLAALGVPAPDGSPGDPPPLAFTPAERAAAEPVLSRLPPVFLAIHPGSGSPRKNWPAPLFAALARRLAGSAPVLLALGPAEERWLASPDVRAAEWVVARHLPARVLAAVLSRASLYVGNDSGASHLAAAAGAPTLALFGPTDPASWLPVGPLVEGVRSPTRAMDDLDLESVAQAAARLRSAASEPPSAR